jgi:hypothetical protein
LERLKRRMRLNSLSPEPKFSHLYFVPFKEP